MSPKLSTQPRGTANQLTCGSLIVRWLCCAGSGRHVAAPQQHLSRSREQYGVAEQDEPCRQLRERVGVTVGRSRKTSRERGEPIRRDRVAHPGHQRQQALGDEQPRERADERADLVAHERPDANADPREQRARGAIGGGPPQRIAERGPALNPANRQDHLHEHDVQQHDEQAEHQSGQHVRQQLRGDDATATRNGQQRRRDCPVAELRADGEHSEHEREQLHERRDPDEVVSGLDVAPAAERSPQRGDAADQQNRAERQRKERPRGAQLQQLARQRVLHEGFSPAPSVSSKKTSSSDCTCGASSEMTIPFAAIARPICSPLRSTTRIEPSASAAACTVAPSERSSSPRRPTSGPATRTPPLRCAISSLSGACATERPRWITTTSSAVCATSLSTWLETSTARPSAASPRRKSRSQRIPCGSRPFAGSSSTSTRGSPSSAAARPSRWRMPREYPFVRRRPSVLSSTSCSSSSTRASPIPAPRASVRRWLRPLRPGCSIPPSSSAPTVPIGFSSST